MNSNKIEKLNGKIRDRGKVMRGLKKKNRYVVTERL